MLFGYPAEGFQDNWLHEALMEMLGADMDRIDADNAPEPWPNCIPAVHRAKLTPRDGLKLRRGVLLAAYEALSVAEREKVRGAMVRQNEIPALFDDIQPCVRVDELPEDIQHAVKELFKFAFSILKGLGLRDENYARFYEHLRHRVCAFCGMEPLDSSEQKREALDHYLSIDRYPFAGANFRNLSPMGTKCNSRYKLQQDILVDPISGNRRKCCDPYASPEIELRLTNSRPFEGETINLSICPDWVIEWKGGDADRLQVWETVFDIQSRFKGSSLNPNFRDWVSHFAQWTAATKGELTLLEDIRVALEEFARIVIPEGYADSAFLKRAMILMLAAKCDDTEPGERLRAWLADLISGFAALDNLAA